MSIRKVLLEEQEVDRKLRGWEALLVKSLLEAREVSLIHKPTSLLVQSTSLLHVPPAKLWRRPDEELLVAPTLTWDETTFQLTWKDRTLRQWVVEETEKTILHHEQLTMHELAWKMYERPGRISVDPGMKADFMTVRHFFSGIRMEEELHGQGGSQ